MDDPKFWTVAELATLFRTSKMTVYREIHTGNLAATQIGRSFRVPDAAVTTYLNPATPTTNGHRQPPPPPPSTKAHHAPPHPPSTTATHQPAPPTPDRP
jgi:excisionase family DNA binding protein